MLILQLYGNGTLMVRRRKRAQSCRPNSINHKWENAQVEFLSSLTWIWKTQNWYMHILFKLSVMEACLVTHFAECHWWIKFFCLFTAPVTHFFIFCSDCWKWDEKWSTRWESTTSTSGCSSKSWLCFCSQWSVTHSSTLTSFCSFSQWDSVGATRPACTGDGKHLKPAWQNLLESCCPLTEWWWQCVQPGRQVSKVKEQRQVDVWVPLRISWLSSPRRLPEFSDSVLSCVLSSGSCLTGWRWSWVVVRAQRRAKDSLTGHCRRSVSPTHSRKKNNRFTKSTSVSRWDQTAANA